MFIYKKIIIINALSFYEGFKKKYNYIKILLVKLKKSQKEKEKAFYLIPRTQPRYFLKYQIQKHPATDAYMPHQEMCVWVGERKRDRTSGASSL